MSFGNMTFSFVFVVFCVCVCVWGGGGHIRKSLHRRYGTIFYFTSSAFRMLCRCLKHVLRLIVLKGNWRSWQVTIGCKKQYQIVNMCFENKPAVLNMPSVSQSVVIQDGTLQLWITESIKRADRLTGEVKGGLEGGGTMTVVLGERER